MARCDYCGETINGLPWNCKRCGQTFCDNHRLPENHDCSGIKKSNFFEPLTKKSISTYKKAETKREEDYEMYIPGRKKHFQHQHFPRESLGFNDFLRKYIYPRIQSNVEPHLMQFLLIFIIGLVLNYVYYQTFSLTYLFIGGVQEWFSVLIPTLNGFSASYDLFYLIINGIYYAYFYYSFVLVIYHAITNLDKRDTWVMLGWFALIVWALIYFFPQIV
ncbi:MAG: zinc finger AN1 domain-containing stress-associated protein [Novosphingobium sp.]|nr:zinc finger AN1 domain-containing stress-associated protein [Novosphingobium sp.]